MEAGCCAAISVPPARIAAIARRPSSRRRRAFFPRDSESAFSAGGRTLDDFRTSLTSTMVERLVCTNDWLRANDYITEVEEDHEAMAKLEEGNLLSVLICYQFYCIRIEYMYIEK